MDAVEAIQSRRSIRAFLSRPVPKDLIAQVLEVSRWAPSGCNRQPWRVTVATGETCNALADGLIESIREREPHAPCSSGSTPSALVTGLSQQAERLGQSLYEFVVVGSYAFYRAPVVMVISQADGGGDDVSSFVTTMLIAAHNLGLGTCWLGHPLSHADLIRQALDIPEDERIRAVVALGYPDLDSPANAFRSPRNELETFVRWVGFD